MKGMRISQKKNLFEVESKETIIKVIGTNKKKPSTLVWDDRKDALKSFQDLS